MLGTAFCCAAAGSALAQTKPVKTARPNPKPAASANRQAALLTHEAAITALIQQMTLEEKLHLVHANSAFAAGASRAWASRN